MEYKLITVDESLCQKQSIFFLSPQREILRLQVLNCEVVKLKHCPTSDKNATALLEQTFLGNLIFFKEALQTGIILRINKQIDLKHDNWHAEYKLNMFIFALYTINDADETAFM